MQIPHTDKIVGSNPTTTTSHPFYVLGEQYRLIGYKEPLTVVGFDDTYVHFEWMDGLKYWVVKTKRHINMYKKVRR